MSTGARRLLWGLVGVLLLLCVSPTVYARAALAASPLRGSIASAPARSARAALRRTGRRRSAFHAAAGLRLEEVARAAGTRALRVPKHVGIIPDGNGRWALARGFPRAAGHAKGADAAFRAVMELFDRGVEVVTLFTLSTENLHRDPAEVSHIMRLVTQLLRMHADTLTRNGVAVQIVHSAGCAQHLPVELYSAIADLRAKALAEIPRPEPSNSPGSSDSEAPFATASHAPVSDETKTAYNLPASSDSESNLGEAKARKTLCLLLAYGSRIDLADAAREIARQAAAGLLDPESVDEKMLASHLATGAEAR
ncbi:Decaprenyl diphosphate synthase-like protein [Pavlovales sp. CCMP2436]|nr:Decaprenyl diphosphate synthase-like protein [Pavlovales sp. CCMP2436]